VTLLVLELQQGLENGLSRRAMSPLSNSVTLPTKLIKPVLFFFYLTSFPLNFLEQLLNPSDDGLKKVHIANEKANPADVDKAVKEVLPAMDALEKAADAAVKDEPAKIDKALDKAKKGLDEVTHLPPDSFFSDLFLKIFFFFALLFHIASERACQACK